MVKEKRTYFLSDLHLGAYYLKDSRMREKMIVSFLDSIKNDADAIYLLGDILDYWYEYKFVVPRGYVRFFGKLAELTDAGIRVVWFKGNHDIWIYDYLPDELGIEVVDGYLIEAIHGKRFFLSHGDGLGDIPKGFKFIRTLFRNKACQLLFSGIHPRWTVPFAYNWSRHSRKVGGNMENTEKNILNNLKKFVRQCHKENPDIDYFVFGHLHLLSREEIDSGCEMVILGDWLHIFSYGMMSNEGFRLLKWDMPEKE